MANDVNLSASIRTNLLSLQRTNSLFDRTSERLSTGKKVNSALDGASPFFTARDLNNRANDLAALKDGMGQAIQTLKTADKAITSITALVGQAKTLAEQAKEASSQVSRISSATAASAAATAGSTLTTAFGGTAGFSTTNEFMITVTGGGVTTIAYTAGMTITSLTTMISAVDTGITASFNTTNQKIEITASAGVTVTLDSGATGKFGGHIFTAAEAGSTTVFGSTGTGTNVATLEADFEKVMAEINKLYADAGYKGINLLNGNNLDVTTNENSATLTITGTTLNVTGLKFSATTVDWTTSASIDTSIAEAGSALTTLRSTAPSFSTDLSLLQTRETFTDDLIQTLEAGAGLLVNANLEEESANLLALQTRQALGTSSLSFANQTQQSVLQLFR